jgi:hypothetical protein
VCQSGFALTVKALTLKGRSIMSTSPSGTLRVSDADRDQAIAELSVHFQAGRLTVEELDDRTGRALAARTSGELADLFTDLPRQKASVPSAAPDRTTVARTGSFPLALMPALPIAIIAIVVFGSLFSGHHGGLFAVPVLLVLFIVRRLSGDRRRDYRHDRGL